MTSRERLLTALENKTPDRLPCQVHGWMPYYLNNYLDGIDQWQAYEKFDMDFVIYNAVEHRFDERDQANWKVETIDHGVDSGGIQRFEHTIKTPEGTLNYKQGKNDITIFDTEPLIKTKEDFELYNKYWPVPVSCKSTSVDKNRDRLGDRGIVRTYGIAYYFGQASPWQSLCYLMETQPAIMAAIDDSQWVHYALESLLEKSLRVIELCKDVESDLIETGGGAGSNTVISPKMFEEFCLPYDTRQHRALHKAGFKASYHLCGGMMQMADMVVENGADALETMTPASMGGDCDLAKACEKWGDKLCFIGGFDQNAGFENGTAKDAKRLVRECFEATKDHTGYICCPSDHFFNGDPENIQAFVEECK